MSWSRWGGAAGVTAAAIGAAALTLGITRWAENRYDREFAFRIAATTAAYIATVTPPPPPPPAPPAARGRRPPPPPRSPRPPRPAPAPAPQTRDYHLPQLLTNARALRNLPGWTTQVEVYYGTAPLVDATAPPLSPQDLEQLDSAGGRWRGGAAIVPLKDREGRDVVGAVAARPRTLPRGPLPGGLGFAWPMALIAVGGGAAIAFRRLPLRRGGYAAAALLLGIAAYADVRATARRSTDRWLSDSRRLLQEAAARLPTPASRVPLTELYPLIGDAELVPGEPGESAPQRVRIDGKRRAIAAVLLGPGRWVELRTVPKEDSSAWWLVLLLAAAYTGPLAIWTLRWAERTPQRRRRETAIAWGFLAPAGLHLAVFTVGPLLAAIYFSLRAPGSSVTLTNFTATLRDPLTLVALRNTALYSLYVPISAAVALFIALLLDGHRGLWAGRILRTVFLLPYLCSVVAIGLVWQLIYQSGRLGVGRSDWLSSPNTALIGLMLIALWAHVGGQIMVFLAGLRRVPQACLDAARLDGAGPWRRFRRITFPLLRPVTAFVLITGIIGAFQVFTLVYVLTRGGPLPQHSTDVLVHRIYETAWGGAAFGLASASGVLLFLLLAVLMWTQLKLLGRQAEHA